MPFNTKKPDQYYRFPRREMLQYIPEGVHRVLEIGCGEGLFGRELKKIRAKQGITVEVTGIELDAERAVAAAAHLDRVLIADVERDGLDLSLGYYDCIVFNDVLEHLVYPWRVLDKIGKYLHSNGYIVASIPNVRYLGVIKDLLVQGDSRY